MTARDKLIVVGAGGFALEVMDAASLVGWCTFELYDDNPARHGQRFPQGLCVGHIAKLERSRPCDYIICIGNNAVRQTLSTRLEAAGHAAVSVFHPNTVISPTASIGAGTFLAPFSWVGPNTRIGRHALINMGASIGHDAVLGDWVQLCPGTRISGFCSIEDGAFLGSNSVVAPRIKMGKWSQLAATSFAWRDVPAGRLAVGSPAKIAPIP